MSGVMSASRRLMMRPSLSTRAARAWVPEMLIPIKFDAGVVIAIRLVWGGCRWVARRIDDGFRAVKQVVLGVELQRYDSLFGLWPLVFGLDQVFHDWSQRPKTQ